MSSRSTEQPSIGWCAGKDCRKADRDGALRALAEGRCRVVELRCLDLCDGAVIVGPLDGRRDDDTPLVFHEVRKPRVVRNVVDHLVDGTHLTPAAVKRRVDGSKRARAVRRIEPKR